MTLAAGRPASLPGGSPSSSRPGRERLAGFVPPLVVALVCHGSGLGSFFASDDITFLTTARTGEGLAGSPLRWLSGPVAWSVMVGAFGLDPLPFNVARLLAHGIATALTYALGVRLLGTRWAAMSAAAMFAASPAAFTPVRWASGFAELLTAVFALAAGLAFTSALRSRSRVPAALAVLFGSLAMICKEVAFLLPLPLALALFRHRSERGEPRSRNAAVALSLLLGVAAVLGVVALALARSGRFLGGAAYATSLDVRHLAQNLSTYLWWATGLAGPIPDQVAAVDPGALGAGVLVTLVAAGVLFAQRRDTQHPCEFGAVWFLAFLAPVLPLLHHTYSYYLYLPWAGGCWFVAGAMERAVRGRPAWFARGVVGLVALVFVSLGMWNLRARERLQVHGLPADRTMRESLLVRNAITGLREADLPAGGEVAFVNPYPRAFQDIASREIALRPRPTGRTYTPFEAALRDGETLRVFLPSLSVLGFGERVLPEWEAADVFLYENDGRLVRLGRGLEAQRAFGAIALDVERWDLAEPTFRRMLALGDTTADAAFGLLTAVAGQRREQDARPLVLGFVRRWPRDPRAAALAAWLASGGN